MQFHYLLTTLLYQNILESSNNHRRHIAQFTLQYNYWNVRYNTCTHFYSLKSNHWTERKKLFNDYSYYHSYATIDWLSETIISWITTFCWMFWIEWKFVFRYLMYQKLIPCLQNEVKTLNAIYSLHWQTAYKMNFVFLIFKIHFFCSIQYSRRNLIKQQ